MLNKKAETQRDHIIFLNLYNHEGTVSDVNTVSLDSRAPTSKHCALLLLSGRVAKVVKHFHKPFIDSQDWRAP